MHQPKVKYLIREVKVRDIIFYFVLQLIIIPSIWIIYALDFIPLNRKVLLIICIILTYIALRLFAIGSILMYKAFAPMSIRSRCLFEPCCSTYMMICLIRYGFIIGIPKGIKRILRCKPPNGGIDWP